MLPFDRALSRLSVEAQLKRLRAVTNSGATLWYAFTPQYLPTIREPRFVATPRQAVHRHRMRDKCLRVQSAEHVLRI